MTWPIVPLAELIAAPLANGRSVPTQAGGFPVLRLTALRKGAIDLGERKGGAWTRDDAERFLVRAGDFLIARGNGSLDLVGRGGLVSPDPDPVAFPDTMIRVRPDTARLEPRYLALAWTAPAVRTQIEDSARTTAGIYKINQAHLGAIRIPLPPLDEQRRIVDILEDHLSRLDAANAGVADAGRKVAALQWSALSSAVRKTRGKPVALGELASVKNGIYVSRPQADPNGVPILRIGAIRPLLLDLSDLRYSAMPESEINAMGGLLRAGDLLFTRYNGNPKFVGACAVVTDALLPLTYPDKLIRVRPDTERVVPEFLSVACSVGSARAQIQAAVKTTSGQAGISGRDLKAVEVLLPSLQDQARIARMSVEVASDSGRLARSVDETRMRSAALRRSLLAAVFSGRLTRAASDVSDAALIEELAGV